MTATTCLSAFAAMRSWTRSIRSTPDRRASVPERDSAWSLFDQQMERVRNELGKLGLVPSGSREIFVVLRSVDHMHQKLLIEHLSALIDAAKPSDAKTWDDHVSKSQIRFKIKAARQACEKRDDAALANAYHAARVTFVQVQFAVLIDRTNALTDLVQLKPERLESEAWGEIWNGGLSEECDSVTVDPIDSSEPVDDQEAAFETSQIRFLMQRVSLLRAAATSAAGFLRDDAELKHAAAEIGTAETMRRSLETSRLEEQPTALAAADKAGINAQQAYADFVTAPPYGASAPSPFSMRGDPTPGGPATPRSFAPAAGGFGKAGGMLAPIHLGGADLSRSVVDAIDHTQPTEAQLLRKIDNLDNRVRYIMMGVTILTGLGTLWLSNPAWGSGQHYLTALLWGFGFNEASNAIGNSLQPAPPTPEEEPDVMSPAAPTPTPDPTLPP